MVQLAGWQERFEAAGVRLAGMTYDDLDILKRFHDEQALGFPLLRDVDVKHVDAYGVRNQEYEPGDAGYGIPYPGVLYVSADGTVLAKFAVPGYRQRPPFDEMLDTVVRLNQAE